MDKKHPTIVHNVDETTMDGDNELERKLNAFLTRRFILGGNVPSDECLTEAKEIIHITSSILEKPLIDHIRKIEIEKAALTNKITEMRTMLMELGVNYE
jgi:hypothetical protein